MKKMLNTILGIGIVGLTILSMSGIISSPISTNTIETEFGIVNVYENNNTFIALDSNGNLWGWGNNDYGQVGNGDTNQGINQETPIQITGSGSTTNPTIIVDFVDVYGTNGTFIALDENGDLWGWGDNEFGQVGNGENGIGETQNSPVQITDTNGGDPVFEDVSSGLAHNIALDSNGDLWGWGFNSFGQVGNGTTIDQNIPIQITGSNSVVNPLITVGFVDVYSSDDTFIARDENNDLWGWGRNTKGQVGNNSINIQKTPIQITGTNSVNPTITVEFDDVYGTDDTFIALDKNKDLWGWGKNPKGQVGNGNQGTNQTIPVQITGSNSLINPTITIGFDDVYGVGKTFIARDENNDLWGWGDNVYGQIGNGNSGSGITQDSPIQITGSGQTINPTITVDFIEVYPSDDSSTFIACDSNNDLWSWGQNNYGQVGNGESGSGVKQTTPIKITGSDSLFNPSITVGFVDVYANSDTFIALDTNGDLWGWGDNEFGQVGNGESGSGETQNSPVQITGLESVNQSIIIDFVDVYSNNDTFIAYDENGNLWGWGENPYGQVGNGTSDNQTTPIQITTKFAIDSPIVSNITETSIDVTYSWTSSQQNTLQYQVLDEDLIVVTNWIDLPFGAQPNGVDTEYTFTIEGLTNDRSYFVKMRDSTIPNKVGQVNNGELIELEWPEIGTPIVSNITETSIEVTYSWDSAQISTLEYRVLDEDSSEIISWTELPSEGQPTNGIDSYTFTIEELSNDKSYFVQMRDIDKITVVSKVNNDELIELEWPEIGAPIVSNVTETSIDVTYFWNSTQISTLEYRVLDKNSSEIIPWTDLPSEGQPINGVDSYTFTIEELSNDTSYYVEMRDAGNPDVVNQVKNSDLIVLVSGTNTGMIIGIIIGSIVGLGLISGGIYFAIKKRT